MNRWNKPSLFHPNDRGNPDRVHHLLRRRGSQDFLSDDDYRAKNSVREPVAPKVNFYQSVRPTQNYREQYYARSHYPAGAVSSDAHDTRSSSKASHSEQKNYHSTAPQGHRSSDYTPPLRSNRQRKSHSESAPEKQKGYQTSAPQDQYTSSRAPGNYSQDTQKQYRLTERPHNTEDERTRPPKEKNRGGSKSAKRSALDYIEPVVSMDDDDRQYEWINSDNLDDSQLVDLFAIVHFGGHVRQSRFDGREKIKAFDGVVFKEGRGLDMLKLLKKIAASRRGREFGIRIHLEPKAKAVKKILDNCNIDRENFCGLGVYTAYRYIREYMGYEETGYTETDCDEANYEDTDQEEAVHEEAVQNAGYYNNLQDWEKNIKRFQYVTFPIGHREPEGGVYDERVWGKVDWNKLQVQDFVHNTEQVKEEILFGVAERGKKIGREKYDFEAGCTVNLRNHLRSKGCPI